MSMYAFEQQGDTVTISAVDSDSSNVAISQGGESLWVHIEGENSVWVALGTDDEVTADDTNARRMIFHGNSANIIRKRPEHTHIAARSVSGNATVYFTPGRGV